MRYFRSERGSVLVESISSLALLTTLVGGGLTLLYLLFAHIWLDRAAYEASICLTTSTLRSTCQQKFYLQKSSVLPWGELSDVHLVRNSHRVSTTGELKMAEQTVLRFESTLQLPLVKSHL